MKPIKNVFAACDGSKKGYSVNGSESTLMLVGQKWDEDKAPVMSAIFVYIMRHVIRIKKHLHDRIEIIEIESNRKEYESLQP